MALESFQQQKACIAVAYEPQARKDVADALRCAEAVSKALIKSAINSRIVKITKDLLADKDYLQAALKRECPLVFNLFEGFNDDARAEIEFARLLEKANVCFTGNSSKTLNDCLDKLKTKQILYSEGITIPRGFLIRHENEIDDLLKVDIALPFFIKPCFEDASVGIDAASLINQRETIYTQITDKLRDNPGGILVEEFIPGNEYTVAMLAPEEDKIIGVSRIDYKLYPRMLPFVSYDSKWNTDSLEYKTVVPSICTAADLGQGLWEELITIAFKASKALGCDSYTRVDIREKDNKMYVIDVNPNPDLNTDSGFIRQAYARGFDYSHIIMKIFSSAKTLQRF